MLQKAITFGTGAIDDCLNDFQIASSEQHRARFVMIYNISIVYYIAITAATEPSTHLSRFIYDTIYLASLTKKHWSRNRQSYHDRINIEDDTSSDQLIILNQLSRSDMLRTNESSFSEPKIYILLQKILKVDRITDGTDSGDNGDFKLGITIDAIALTSVIMTVLLCVCNPGDNIHKLRSICIYSLRCHQYSIYLYYSPTHLWWWYYKISEVRNV